MQLSSAAQRQVGVDLGTFTRTEVSEIVTAELVKAIGKGAGFNVDNILDDVPDVCGLHLLKEMECDLGNDDQILTRICLLFDWKKYRLTVASEGEQVTIEIVPGTMTFPAIRAQAEALEKLLRSIGRIIPYTQMQWCYQYDADALERRGRDWLQKRLGTAPKTPEEKARYDSFRGGRRVTQSLDMAAHQRLSVTLAEGM